MRRPTSSPSRPGPGTAVRAARLRRHAGAAVRVHAEQARHLHRLPPPLPLRLRRPPGAAQGPAVGTQLARRERAHGAARLVRAAAGAAHPRGATRPAQGHLGPRGLPRRRPGARGLPPRPRLARGLRRGPRPRRRAARRRAGGGGEDGGARLQRPGRPHRRRAATSWSSSTTRPAAQASTPTTPAAPRRSRSTPSRPSASSAAHAAASSCTTCPTGTVAAHDHTEASIARQVSRAEDTARDIVAAEKAVAAGTDPDEAFPTTPGPMCGWCDFRRSCPVGAELPAKDQWAGIDRTLTTPGSS